MVTALTTRLLRSCWQPPVLSDVTVGTTLFRGSLFCLFFIFFVSPSDMVESAFYLCAYELAIKTVNSPWCQLLDEVDAQVHTLFAVPVDS